MKNLSKCLKGKLLDNLYHQKCCKLIGIDISRQRNMDILQQVIFIGKLEDDGAKCFLLLKSSKK